MRALKAIVTGPKLLLALEPTASPGYQFLHWSPSPGRWRVPVLAKDQTPGSILHKLRLALAPNPGSSTSLLINLATVTFLCAHQSAEGRGSVTDGCNRSELREGPHVVRCCCCYLLGQEATH